MKSIVTLALLGFVAIIFLAQEIDAVIWNSMLIKRNVNSRGSKKEEYIRLPKSTYDPRVKDYVKVSPGENYSYPIDFYCKRNDSRVCVLYDYLGNPAGIQFSFFKEDFNSLNKSLYDISKVKGFEETNLFGKPAYSAIVYFTNPCTLSEAGRLDTNEIAEALWIKIDGEWVMLDRCQPNGPRTGNFFMQGCYPRTGTVFVYKFNRYSCCEDPFLLYVYYDQGSLVGFGLMVVGRGGSRGPRTDWYSHPSGKRLAELLPVPPPCFRNFLRYGFTSLNLYLVDDPDKIRCLQCRA